MTTVDLTWLGQAGFLLEADGVRLLIDPWVTAGEGRLIPSPPLDLVADRIDCVLVTHEHADHLDLPFLAQLVERSPRRCSCSPSRSPIRWGRAPPLSRAPGRSRRAGGLEREGRSRRHAVRAEDACTDGGGRFVGYLVRVADTVLYHAGDTVVTEALLSALADEQIDVALLPINGRDFFREADGFVGNLDACEAVELARRLRARTLVPYHWDGFAGNTERPGRAVDNAAATGALHVLCLARLIPFRLCC